MQKLIFRNAKNVEVDFTDLENFGITKWSGLSEVDLDIQTQKVPFDDGSVYLDSLLQDRLISITVAVNDSGDLKKRYELKRKIISILNPKLSEGYLIYTNDFLSKRIKCIPQIPIFPSKNADESGTLKCSISFECCSPYWEDVEENVLNLNTKNTVSVDIDSDIDVPVKINMSIKYTKNPKIENIISEQKIELVGEFSDDLEIETSLGNKKIISQKYELNILNVVNGLFNDACSLGDDVIIAGDNELICKLDLNDDLKFIQNNKSITSLNISSNSINKVLYNPILKKIFLHTKNGVQTEILKLNEKFVPEESIYLSSGSNVINLICNSNNGTMLLLYRSGSKTYFYKSTDGSTWTNVENSYVFIDVGYFEKENCFVGITSDKLLKSTDGSTWTEVSSISNIICMNSNKDYVVIGCSGGTIYYTSDLTNIKNRKITVNGSIYSKDIMSILFDENKNNYYFKASEEIVFTYDVFDVGYIMSISDVSEINKIVSNKYRTVAIGSSNGKIIISEIKNYNNLKKIYPKNEIETGYINNIIRNPISKNYLAGCKNGIFESSDFENWDLIYSASNVKTLSYCESKQVFFASTGKTILYSYDGKTWNSNDCSSKLNTNIVQIVYNNKRSFFEVTYGNSELNIFTISDIYLLPTSVPSLIYSGNIYNTYNDFYQDSIRAITGNSSRSGGLNSYGQTQGFFGHYYPGEQITPAGLEKGYIERHYRSIISVNNLNFISSTDGKILVSEDVKQEPKEIVQMNYGAITRMFYSKSEQLIYCFGLNILITIDLNYNIKVYEISGVVNDMIVDNYNRYLVGNFISKLSIDSESKRNQISKISSDSDMSFKLIPGKNILSISCEEGYISANVVYRNKYIGV